MSKLPYIEACLRETLRLNPPVFSFSIQPLPETTDYPVIIGGKYELHKGDVILPILPKVHRDPAVYGEDAEEFKPERMLDEPFSKLPPNSWKVRLICETLF
jgi:cytochrome P450/NADPH-cytochrome P450 reductase